MSIYYTYYSYETNKGIDGLGYIGYRKLQDAPIPELENYFGSQVSPKNKEFKENPNKAKIILGIFDSKEKALEHEIKLHELWDVGKNPHFANQAKQTSTGFSNEKPWNKGKELHYNVWNKGINRTLKEKEKISNSCKGRMHSEESLEKISIANKGKTYSKDRNKKIGETNSRIQKGRIPWNKGRKTGKNKKEEGDFFGEKFNYINLKTGQKEENITVSEMIHKYNNLKKNGLYRLNFGKFNTYRGWIIEKSDNQQRSLDS